VIRIDDIKSNLGYEWVFHDRDEVDIAIIPFPFEEQIDDYKVIPEKYFLSCKEFYELNGVFFLSYQPGIKIQTRITPIFRIGAISIMNEDDTFYIDAPAFPGNSGSPVFLEPYIEEGGATKSGFIGIIGEYIPYIDYAISPQTKHVRVTFEENTGLSKVWSVSYLNEIIKSKNLRRQIDG
jgi:hypothetical protein